MYCSHYGFSERPFEVTPDPMFLYLSPAHREVLSTLLYGIRERRGFVVVLGEAGTGKTTLLRSVLGQLEENVKVATILNTDVTFDEFLHMVLIDLGLAQESEQLGKVVAIQRLNQLAIGQLRSGGNVVIMVDEAQNLDRRFMENLRLLSNLETSKTKLLQIILSGQPELEDKLRRSDLRQLSQRVNLRRYLLPLNEKETYACIQHRLTAAHYQGPALFTRGAQRLVWEYSGGIPRMINTVCDNALLTGYALMRRKIDERMVREVIDDLTRSPFAERSARPAETSPYPFPLPETEPARHRFRSLKVLLPVAGVCLLVGIGLGTWRQHWNAHSPSVLRGQIQTSTTEVRTPPAAIAVLPPASATDAEKGSPSVAVIATAAETNPLPVPQEQPDPIQDATAPLPTREANLTQSEAEKQETEKASSSGAVLATTAEANPQPVPPSPPDPVQVATAPLPTREAPLTQSEAGEQAPASNRERESAIRSQRSTTVRVRSGESLSAIIVRNFGRYDKALEQEILLRNPGIKNAGRIYVGQAIILPAELPGPQD